MPLARAGGSIVLGAARPGLDRAKALLQTCDALLQEGAIANAAAASAAAHRAAAERDAVEIALLPVSLVPPQRTARRD